ncbi:hypothetical protein Dalk_2583 [Desulfatibacillum aliphaticivorans]|uniref:Antitoxin SocA-like Panacea domain-containing protein n=1 Tax=Desulfatibacillum aliphaticivorans TaxID=218208 RepID=B8FFL6_DESAL|nr:type II toxin-antitoxin system antitoxin SocA domain-containing protein [Desulfatibacillum aliphaticivorans]ACL04276.1 hypothetical protein Dalk_2583 [Desulfatibacillum aliphaticivorans]
MAIKLENLLQAILSHYEGNLDVSTLTKMVYLVDLESVRRHGVQISCIEWVRDNCGPFGSEVQNCALQNPDLFDVKNEKNGDSLIGLKDGTSPLSTVSSDVLDIVKAVISNTPNPRENYRSFVDYVYKTAPMLLSTQNGPLDVVASILSEQEVDAFIHSVADDEEWQAAMDYLAVN